jgi:acetyl-CoA C-acetyltransferase
MTSKHSVLIAEPVRTAIGTFGGTLKDIPAVELGATAIRAALQRSGLRLGRHCYHGKGRASR